MKLVILMLLFTSIISAQNFNKDLKSLKEENQKCLDKGEDMLGCYRKYYIQMDSLLNTVYKNSRSKLNLNQQQELKNIQLLWLKNRDIKFKKIDSEDTGLGNSSDDLMFKIQKKADFVSERISFLIANYTQGKNTVNYKNQILKFVPENFEILDTVKGNLNNDIFDDYILVLKKKNEEDTSKYMNDKPEKRPLLILIGNSDNNLELKARNDNTVLCIDCSGAIHGDSYEGVKIKNGYFSVEHYTMGGNDKWTKVITFKYEKAIDNWVLHKDGMEYFRLNNDTRPDAEAVIKTGEEILTKKNFGIVPFENYDIYK